jgi:S-adenosylmethionine:tRNA ribosyltransferase-isomerase
MNTLDFVLPADLEAHEPPEARGVARDGVRLLVGRRGGEVTHHRFTDLPDLLRAGDVLVVNTSGTLAAAVPVADRPLVVHFSTELPDSSAFSGVRGGRLPRDPQWLVEIRRQRDKAAEPFRDAVAGERLPLRGGAVVTLREAFSEGRLWAADVSVPVTAGSTPLAAGVLPFLARHGRPIRYGYVPRPWSLDHYQTVFANRPGSAEMPSAARPFTDRLVTRLVSAGVLFAPVLLHTGVASPEAHERPYPERFQVSATTARLVNRVRAEGGRLIAVGTTAVRALETATGRDGLARAAAGWTELIMTPERGVRVVDGLLTGLHEPRASHLDLLAAVAGRDLLDRCYAEAITNRYLWHEFGDVNLLLP